MPPTSVFEIPPPGNERVCLYGARATGRTVVSASRGARRIGSPLTLYNAVQSTRHPRLMRRQAPQLTKILDLISRAEALRAGAPAAAFDDSDRRVSPDLDEGPPDGRSGTGSGAAIIPAGEDELGLLREAVDLEDSLGYDEPPNLPVPTRLYLGAALLRAEGDEQEAAREATKTFARLDEDYPSMGRTLLGIARAAAAQGNHSEAEQYQARFEDAWRHSDVVLEDSAHIREASGGGGGGGDGYAPAAFDFEDGDSPANSTDREAYDEVWTTRAVLCLVSGIVLCVFLLVFIARIIFQNTGYPIAPPVAAARLEERRTYQSIAEYDSLVPRARGERDEDSDSVLTFDVSQPSDLRDSSDYRF